MRKQNAGSHKTLFTAFILLLLLCSLYAAPATSLQNAQNALTLCASILIPSLFPFLFLSAFSVHSGFSETIGKFLGPLFGFLFKLPGAGASGILLGWIGGYPSGAKTTAQLFHQGLVTRREAQRMLLFCVNPGPAFAISAVGTGILHSRKAGILIFVSLLLANLCMGILSRFVLRNETTASESPTPAPEPLHLATAFTQSAADAASAMLSICAWVLLFASFSAMLTILPLNAAASPLLHCALEVTAGLSLAAGAQSIPFFAAVLSFAGLCVHCQILPTLAHIRLRYRYFLAARLLSALMSFGFCTLLLRLFPCEIPVLSGSTPLKPYWSFAPVPAAAGLIILSVFLILEVEHQRKIC